MILSPVLASLFVRAQPDPGQDISARRARIETLRRRLWPGTAVAVAAFLALYFGVSAQASYFMWMAAFPLWFLGTMPLLQAKDRGWRPMQQKNAIRTATRQRRDVDPPALHRARMYAWAAWALVGIAGAAYGMRADLYRARLNRLYQGLYENGV